MRQRKVFDQRVGKRVERLRAIERDDGDGAVFFDQ